MNTIDTYIKTLSKGFEADARSLAQWYEGLPYDRWGAKANFKWK